MRHRKKLAGWILLATMSGTAPLADAQPVSNPPEPTQPTHTLTPSPGDYELESDRVAGACGQGENPEVLVAMNQDSVSYCWGDREKYPTYPKDFKVSANTAANKFNYQWNQARGWIEINGTWFKDVKGYNGLIGGKVVAKDRFYVVDVIPQTALAHKLTFRSKKASTTRQTGLQRCRQTCIENVLASRVSPGMLGIFMLPAEGQRRTVTGQFLLGLRNPSTARDERLWNCIFMNGNYPGIHFVDGNSHSDEWAFVWPSAFFRITLMGGATYSWRVAPPIRCGVLRAQSYRGEFRVPGTPAPTEEKLLLGCLVADEGFSNCQSWWLRRP